MLSLKEIKLRGKIINLSISTALIFLLLFDFFTQGEILKDNFFYSGRTLFSDLIVIIPNLDELSNWNLFDLEKRSSTELFNRIMNYPVIWVYIFDFLSWFGNPAIIFGVIELFIYILFAKIILLQSNKNFYLYFFMLFSPPVLLMLERGNIDCIIFFLLLSSVLSKNYFSGFLLGLAASLKVFPILILPFYFFFKKINKKFLIGFITTIPLIFWTFLQLKILIATTPISFSSSFGIYSFALFIIKIIKEIFFIDIEQKYIFYFYLFSIFLFFVLCSIFNYLFKKDIIKILQILKNNNQSLMIFILFSTLTVLVFFVFSNWAYRIVLLMPAALVYLNNLNEINKFFDYRKKSLFFLLATAPFFFPWIISTINEDLILLNYYSWAFYSLVVFLSIIFYFLILYNYYLEKIKSIQLNL